MDPPSGERARVVRYEHQAAGDMVHVDIKKVGRIPTGGGWAVHERAKASKRQGTARGAAEEDRGDGGRRLPVRLGVFAAVDGQLVDPGEHAGTLGRHHPDVKPRGTTDRSRFGEV